jgi:diguanylate cyclase (GGDEF)-like protein
MPLRIKLFLGIVLVFSVALSFFGYMAYDSAVKSGTAREMSLLKDLSAGLSRDLRNDIGATPNESAIKAWLHEFDSLHLAIMVAAGNRVWMSDEARNDLPPTLRQQIMRSAKSGSMSVGKLAFVWDTAPVSGTPYTLSVIHRTNSQDAHAFFKRLAVPLIIAALIVLWVAIWSTMYVAALLEKLNAQKDRLQHQAMHDALTNLPNRSLMLERLQTTMQEVDQSGAELALLFIDLNRFKEINDTLGHHYGDLLLVEISKRLLSVLRKSDTVARMGGDEFAVILSHVTEDVARTIAEKLIQVIGQVIEVGGNKLFVSASIGIARYPTHATNANTLVQYADVAMYAAKRAGNGYVIYDAKLDAYSRDKLTLSNDLRDAIERGQMKLQYQAKIDIQTGAIIGAEALLRWQHETFGLVPPDRFIPLAEQTGVMRGLTEFVLETAMYDLQLLLANDYDITFAINLSAVSLHDPELPNMLTKAVAKRDISPDKVVLEITETAVMDQSIQTSEVLQKLDRLGFRVSMDDFGTGHSSLVNLRLLPLQEIKIDRSFVMNMLHNEDDATIVRTIIELGHSLGKNVVAEGVETLAIMQALAKLGCDIAQGYHISRPMPFDAFSYWLAENTKLGNVGDFRLQRR